MMHNAYFQLDTWRLPDYDGEGCFFCHKQSGAGVFHLRNEDPENMFAFAFATHPEDSTGVAHIVEHTVLSGSERFPVKDPFLQLLKGSVNTFLNAMTYPDKTVYPAASPVRKDLFNIMGVYGDAVFFPLLKPELFRQEGHRVQFREDGTLERTGVVYNEMKGNYSSHDTVAVEKCLQSLFPDMIYRNDSGGDPAVIPELTYDGFVDFHRRYYHPSNARIVLYGDIPSEEYLAFLDDRFLSRFEAQNTPGPIPEQPRWSEPRRVETTYPLDGADDLTRRSSVTVNWLLFPVTETRRLLAIAVLTEILLGHSGSPLTKALIDSGLGQDLSPLFGLETDLRDAVFAAGLRGTDPDSADKIETVIFDTLRGLVRNGIPGDLVEGALRRVEFRNRELKDGPNGIRVLRRVVRTWMYGAGPADALNFGSDIAALRDRVSKGPRFFESLIEEHLLSNRHRSTVIVRPDPAQSQREHDREQQELANLVGTITPGERRRIETDSAALTAFQETPDEPEALARIPFLHVEDIPREIRTTECEMGTTAAGVPIYRHHEFTNGIVYLDAAFDFGELSEEDEALLNLLGSAFTEMGLPGQSFDALNREINLKTGGLSAFVSQQTRYSDLSLVRRVFIVRIRTLERSLDEALELLERIVGTIDFTDTGRLEQIVDELHEEMQSALIPNGHYFAGLRAGSGIHGLAKLEERMNGVSQVARLRAFQENNAASLPERLQALFTTLTTPANLSVNVTGDSAAIEAVEKWIPRFTGALSNRLGAVGANGGAFAADRSTAGITPAPATDRPETEFLLASSTVSYVAAVFTGCSHGEKLAPAQDVLAQMLRTGLLWEKIRMKGGAYGAFAASRAAEGLFSLASYRDPHTAVTLDAFREALAELARVAPPESAVYLAKVSVLGRELRPVTPRDAGYVDFRRRLHDITDEIRQELRDKLRSVTAEDVRNVAALLLERFDTAPVAVVGGQEGLEEMRSKGMRTDLVVTELGV